jgi:hypothetical protein
MGIGLVDEQRRLRDRISAHPAGPEGPGLEEAVSPAAGTVGRLHADSFLNVVSLIVGGSDQWQTVSGLVGAMVMGS